MAKLTGGGFTNLPPDRKALRTKLDRSGEEALASIRQRMPVIAFLARPTGALSEARRFRVC